MLSSRLVLIAILASSTPVLADDAGTAALAKIDAAQLKMKSLYIEFEISNTETGKSEKKLGANMWVKGGKMIVEFLAPADMKGTKYLALSPTELYVYLPAFGKVRRIASHVSDQSAFGMAFPLDALAPVALSGDYTATLGAATTGTINVTLAAKDAKNAIPKIEIAAASDSYTPTTIKSYGADGKVVRTETRTWNCETKCVATARTFTTASVTTKLIAKKLKLDENIADDTFSKRNLEK